MTAKSDEIIAELVSACVAFGREKEPDWQTRIETARGALKAHIEELEAECASLGVRLHDEMSQLGIATDLGNKRWIALNDIYENGEKHNANWCKRKAQEGLGIKKMFNCRTDDSNTLRSKTPIENSFFSCAELTEEQKIRFAAYQVFDMPKKASSNIKDTDSGKPEVE